ncbi:MAG: PEGA domain-containing protein [Candidatus Acidiferrales bacterium]
MFLHRTKNLAATAVTALLVLLFALPAPSRAQNQVLGELQLDGATKVERKSGVWVDGQYVGFVEELKGTKKLLLLPGDHQISIRQAGYIPLNQTVTIEPSKRTILKISLEKDPNAIYPAGSTSQIKLAVTPDRAAVFLDDGYVGTVSQFSGMGRAMVTTPGKHHLKIALAGYQAFDTSVSLLPKQKITIKTDLVPGSIDQAGQAIKQN